ncbi:MAG: lipopolysaccharide biosynthesis protein [Limisphaerales bacterium]
MSSKTEPGPASASANESHATFFRQSGWLVVATVSSGVFMTATQVVASRWMEPAEYGVWFALLRVFLLMSIPSVGLQIIFAQQAAAAITDLQQQQLARTTRAAGQATFLIWLVMAAVAVAGHQHWVSLFKITNPFALWATVAIGLMSLWSPVVKGVLQGQQSFAGLGWVLILDGVGRFVAVTVILVLGGQAAGGMTGALIGQVVSLLLGAWFIRAALAGRGARIDWRPWLRHAVPLTLGIGSIQFMSNADVVYVQSVFPEGMPSLRYMPAAMIGLAMVTFTTPLAAVMFPKVVRGTALTQESNAARHAIGTTVLLGGASVLACTLWPKLPLQIIYFSKPIYWEAAPLVPWFVWCLLPLVLANVLLTNLLARERFAVVPWVMLVAIGYGVALATMRPWLLSLDAVTAFRAVVQTLGAFSLLLLAISAWFTRGGRRTPVAG